MARGSSKERGDSAEIYVLHEINNGWRGNCSNEGAAVQEGGSDGAGRGGRLNNTRKGGDRGGGGEGGAEGGNGGCVLREEGEGEYIMVVWTASWAGLACYGVRKA